MTTKEKTTITIEATVKVPVEKAWELWTTPEHIIKWNNASDDWHTPWAKNDLRTGGRFTSRMEAKDGSFGFDFGGTYDNVTPHKLIEYTMDDGRKTKVSFSGNGNETKVTEAFEAEGTHSIEMQRDGWQAILNNFKKYAERANQNEKLRFEIKIEAPVETVYKKMITESSYKEWTSVFNPTSHFIGSWEQGSKILFIGIDEKGNKGGMVSRIRENIPNKFISIEHLGILQGDKEITSGSEVESWAGVLENYTFKAAGPRSTVVTVDMDSTAEYKPYFEETWPKALNKLKTICES